MSEDGGKWTTVIRPGSRCFDLDLAGVWAYRDLILLFVRRDFVAKYKQTVLGPLWFLIQPLLTTLIFTVIFGNVAAMSTDGLPHTLFYLSGVVLWGYFSTCLTATSETFIANTHIFGKVYFPRLCVPVSQVASGLFTLGLQLGIFAVFLGWHMAKGQTPAPGPHALLLPVLVLLMAMLGLGGGIIVSSLTTRYRDLRFLVAFGVQLLMYGSTVIYPLSTVPERYRVFVLLNPMTPIIEAFRYGFLGQGAFIWQNLGISAAWAVGLLSVGVVLFSKVEKNFMDTV